MTVGVLANSGSSILGRDINRNKNISPVVVTFVSMGIGALLLSIIGVALNSVPSISPMNWLFLLWLAVLNTAFAFTLWNHTLGTLKAMESKWIDVDSNINS